MLEPACRTVSIGDSALRPWRTGRPLRLAQEPPADWEALVSRVDALVADGRIAAARFSDVQVQLCRMQDRAGRPEAALARIQRCPGDSTELRLFEARLLLRLDRAAEAEAMARARVEKDDPSWTACMIVGRSLLAQRRRDDAVAFLAEHEMDPEDLKDLDEYYED